MSDAPGTKIFAIVGPTAVGKTALAVQVAQVIDCEAVSADSRQIYRGMDIGTAKPTPQERAQLRHHLLDIVDPDQSLSLAEYLAAAKTAIADIAGRGALPLLVGGTGQYVRALLEGWEVPHVAPDEALRSELYAIAEKEGADALHQRLADVDPLAAVRIDARNVRRVVRALEVYLTLGQPISALQARRSPVYGALIIGLDMAREQLYQRADERIDRMLAEGFVDEVASLMARGYAFDLPAMSSLGYQQIGAYIRGEMPLDEAVLLIRRHTRRLIRQQYNWFRQDNPDIHWYTANEQTLPLVLAEIARFFGQ